MNLNFMPLKSCSKLAFITLSILLCSCSSIKNDSSAQKINFQQTEKVVEPAQEENNKSRSIARRIALYLPNRVFDLLDIVRLRLRVGPGISAGLRASKLTQVSVGSYSSVFVGLPGPRRSASIPIPIGLESHTGIDVSLVEASLSAGMSPNYSPTEIGISLHPLFFGIDLAIDPIELLDFISGFVGIELRNDDL